METWMVRILVTFLVLSTARSTFLDTYEWVSIDCGAETYNLDIKKLINWEPDGEYISSGENKNVSGNNDVTLQMKTLRYFPIGTTNCYSFSVDGIGRYLVRARFYYGNYDRRSKPPTFDVQINDFKWMTVATSLSEEPVVIEGIFSPASDVMRVCLTRSMEEDIPFISSLEVTPVPQNIYSLIHLYSAFLLVDRMIFGQTEDIVYNGNYSGEMFNRIWKARGFPNYPNVSGPSSLPNYVYMDTQPPYDVLHDAMEAPRPSDPIVIPLNLSETNQSLCVMLYFVEVNKSRRPNDRRMFQIDIGSRKNVSTVDLQKGSNQLVTLYPEWVIGPINITISPVQGSNLPPILSAMEAYTVMEMPPRPPAASRVESLSFPFFFVLSLCALSNMLVWL